MDSQEARHLSDLHMLVHPVLKKTVGVCRSYLTQKSLLTVSVKIGLIRLV
jgi:hypothetical protein